MERYLVLTTVTDQQYVNRATETLEEAGVPVIIEHIEIIEGSVRALGYRILVPSHYAQQSLRLLNGLSTFYMNQFAANQ